MSYDLEKMKSEAKRLNRPFTLFGGEPLLMRFEDLENLFAWGLETFGSNAIQTNGVLIEARHVELFRRNKVTVGVSIDGPEELNDARSHRGLTKTRQSTAAVEAAIALLCREYKPPGLIVTLHRGNATADKLPRMTDWVRRLYATGVRSIRLHLLEVDHQKVRDELALSAKENVEALLTFAAVQESLPGMQFDLFEDMEALLAGKDAKVGCIWRACDPYTTEAVQGIEGNGQSSNCGRTNKEGIGFIKASRRGYERYLALHQTPQTENGCAGCRFFLMCKGQCPGTAVDGDWRNRSEHCTEWKQLFGMIEHRMILEGKYPLTIQPLRLELERRQLEAWKRGENPSIQTGLERFRKNPGATLEAVPAGISRPRITWVSEAARQLWQGRLNQVSRELEETTVHRALGNAGLCQVRLVQRDRWARLAALAQRYGVAFTCLPAHALPGGVCNRFDEQETSVFVAGVPEVVEQVEAAWGCGGIDQMRSLLDVPACCLWNEEGRPAAAACAEYISVAQEIGVHGLLEPLGLSILPVMACSLTCAAAAGFAQQWLQTFDAAASADARSWLRQILAWPILYSELHGVTEIKTPLFKMCFFSGGHLRRQVIRREGNQAVVSAAIGLTFPYDRSTSQARIVQIDGTV